MLMNFITATDGTGIFYEDRGSGQPVVFSHGWPLTSDAWDPQLERVADAGWLTVYPGAPHGSTAPTSSSSTPTCPPS
jgi:non-heme chloroperoxidase